MSRQIDIQVIRHRPRGVFICRNLLSGHHGMTDWIASASDETRHLAFGRARLVETFNEKSKNWSSDELQGFRDWLAAYLKSSWGDYYNPTMYKDAGLENGYELRQMAMDKGVELRQKASQKLIDLFVNTGMLEEAPDL